MRPLRAAIVLGLLVGMLGASSLAQVPKPDPLRGDGRVSEFYTWSGELRDLRVGSSAASLFLPHSGSPMPQAKKEFCTLRPTASRANRSLQSGSALHPQGHAPSRRLALAGLGAWHGWDADICAPSWQARSYRDVRYLNEWLSQGFAIVATDYQGLGTPGPHPYLKVRPEAYSVLDSVRAVLKDVPGLANKIIIIGQSQGGGAAFATAAFAPDYAPELDIRGSVATGIPYLAPKAIASARSRTYRRWTARSLTFCTSP